MGYNLDFMINTTPDQDRDAAMFISETFQSYKSLNEQHRDSMTDVYDEYRSFKQKKQNPWSSSFKVNYAHQIVNKTLPRLIAKNPRWLVNLKTDEFRPEDKFLQ
jgi:hypothetical protein